MSARNDYWFGVEVVAKMDLGMLKKVEAIILQAREDAQKQVKYAGEAPYGVGSTGFCPGPGMTGNGPELGKLYMRVYLAELRTLMVERVKQAQDVLYKWERNLEAYHKSLDKNASRWPEYWPDKGAEGTEYITNER